MMVYTLSLIILLGLASATSADEQPKSLSSPSGLEGISLDDLDATRTRPLFAPSRSVTPPPPLPVPAFVQTPEPPPAAQEPPRVSIVGIVIGEDQRIAILRDEQTGEISRVRSGQALVGWTVTVVDALHISLELDDEQVNHRLFDKKGTVAGNGVDVEEAGEAVSGLWR